MTVQLEAIKDLQELQTKVRQARASFLKALETKEHKGSFDMSKEECEEELSRLNQYFQTLKSI